MTGRRAAKVVMVTGRGTGIGRAVAARAVADGASVVIDGGSTAQRPPPAGPALPAGGKLVQRSGRASRWPCRHADEKE